MQNFRNLNRPKFDDLFARRENDGKLFIKSRAIHHLKFLTDDFFGFLKVTLGISKRAVARQKIGFHCCTDIKIRIKRIVCAMGGVAFGLIGLEEKSQTKKVRFLANGTW